MPIRAYYNDTDLYCCAWLSNLMDAGLITPGRIDDRPIQEVVAEDVADYARVHFFAGIGGWERALALADWGDCPVWTGSCPCQPFSAAGARAGAADERHLWPEFMRLIGACRPPIVFGEQVASADVLGRVGGKTASSAPTVWFDGIRVDLEAAHYSVGGVDLPAAGVGAPHIRQRLWWVGISKGERLEGRSNGHTRLDSESSRLFSAGSDFDALANGLAQPARIGLGQERAIRCRSVGGGPEEERSAGSGLCVPSGDAAQGDTLGAGLALGERDGRVGPGAVGTFAGKAALGASDTSGLATASPGEFDGRRLPRSAESLGSNCSGTSSELEGSGGALGLGDAEHSDRRTEHDQNGIASRRDGSGRSGPDRPPSGMEFPEKREVGIPGLARLDGAAGGESLRLEHSNRTSDDRDARGGEQPVRDIGAGCGAWSDWDLIPCLDGKSRRVESGTFPLAHGISNRMGKLRAYGNAICPPVASEFIQAVMTIISDQALESSQGS